MNAIALVTVPTTLEECLMQLARYGSPMVTQFSNNGKWHCRVDMRVNATGVTFEVKATNDTPLDAAQDCYRNMADAIKTVNSIEVKP